MSSNSDAWGSDGDDAALLAQESSVREAAFRSAGYRDGLEAGKEASLQSGFDGGWAAGARAGFAWGQARGAAGALRALAAAAAAPDAVASTRAAELAALGGGALGLPTKALPNAWPRLEARIARGNRADGDAADANAAACAPAEDGDAEAVLASCEAAAARLRRLGVRVLSLEEARLCDGAVHLEAAEAPDVASGEHANGT